MTAKTINKIWYISDELSSSFCDMISPSAVSRKLPESVRVQQGEVLSEHTFGLNRRTNDLVLLIRGGDIAPKDWWKLCRENVLMSMLQVNIHELVQKERESRHTQSRSLRRERLRFWYHPRAWSLWIRLNAAMNIKRSELTNTNLTFPANIVCHSYKIAICRWDRFLETKSKRWRATSRFVALPWTCKSQEDPWKRPEARSSAQAMQWWVITKPTMRSVPLTSILT